MSKPKPKPKPKPVPKPSQPRNPTGAAGMPVNLPDDFNEAVDQVIGGPVVPPKKDTGK